MKDVYEKPTGDIIIVRDFSLKIRKKQRCLLSPVTIQCCSGGSSQGSNARK